MTKKAHANVVRMLMGLLTLFFMGSSASAQNALPQENDKRYEEAKQDAMGICPSIHLLDEKGNSIDPVKNPNIDVPYSPKQTCGKCHDYEKITKGYHFLQGKGEKMGKNFEQTYPWCTSPGQYGGRW